MSFDALIQKVHQAEQALEAYERQGAADWRQLKRSWRTAWSPGRIVVAGLASGFMAGRARPLRHTDGASLLRLVSAVSSLFAIDRAQDAAQQAERAADTAEGTEAAAEDAAAAATGAAAGAVDPSDWTP